MGGRGLLVGWDFAGICKRLGTQLERDNPERLRRQAEAAERQERAFEGAHTYFVLVTPVHGGVHAETIEEFPLVGRLEVRGRNTDHAIVELRFKYATELFRKKLMPTIDEARKYALKCTFIPKIEAPRIFGAVR